jgi:hypothetical protein
MMSPFVGLSFAGSGEIVSSVRSGNDPFVVGRLELVPKPLTPDPSPPKRGEGRRYPDRLLVFAIVVAI